MRQVTFDGIKYVRRRCDKITLNEDLLSGKLEISLLRVSSRQFPEPAQDVLSGEKRRRLLLLNAGETQDEELRPRLSVVIHEVGLGDVLRGLERLVVFRLDHAKPRWGWVENVLGSDTPLDKKVRAVNIDRSLQDPEPVDKQATSTTLADRAVFAAPPKPETKVKTPDVIEIKDGEVKPVVLKLKEK